MGLTGPFGEGESGKAPDWPLMQELQSLAQGRVCGPQQRRKCRQESGAFADWACGVCGEYLRPEAISPWTRHLVFLYQLSQAGYPFRANDLTLETWLLLGVVRRVWEENRRGKYGQGQQ